MRSQKSRGDWARTARIVRRASDERTRALHMCARSVQVESRCGAIEREEETAPRGRVVVQIGSRFARRVDSMNAWSQRTRGLNERVDSMNSWTQ